MPDFFRAVFDCIICCETLEHIDWADIDGVLARFIASGVPHLIISVPYEGFQLAWRYYANGHKMVSKFSLKWRGLFKRFRFDAGLDPHCHRWEVGYRGHRLSDLEAKLTGAGFRIDRRDFTTPCRSVFYVLTNPAAQPTSS